MRLNRPTYSGSMGQNRGGWHVSPLPSHFPFFTLGQLRVGSPVPSTDRGHTESNMESRVKAGVCSTSCLKGLITVWLSSSITGGASLHPKQECTSGKKRLAATPNNSLPTPVCCKCSTVKDEETQGNELHYPEREMTFAVSPAWGRMCHQAASSHQALARLTHS